MELGITGIGAYVPRLRIERSLIAEAHRWMAPSLKGLAKGSRAFANWDEDAITMAVEAARDALRGNDPAALQSLQLASTTFPYADLSNAGIVAGALGLPRSVRCSDAGGSQRAGTAGLLAALKAGEPALFVASDAPLGKPASVQELSYGAGAAAFMLGGGDLLARLLGAASVTSGFVDHFRAAGSRHDYFWEERWIRDEGYAKLAPEAIRNALGQAGVAISEIVHFVMPSLMRGAAEAVAKTVGFRGAVAPSLDAGVGYAGTAHALLMLSHVLETAASGDRILLVGFGQGADALVLEMVRAHAPAAGWRGAQAAIADAIDTDSYLRMLSFAGGIDLEWGMRAEKSGKTFFSQQERAAGQMEAFVAGRCGACGTVQFPQLQCCVNCQAPAAQFDAEPLRDAPAQVLTSTADWLSYYLSPPLYVGFVQFDNGARLLMEMVDVGQQGVDRGRKLRMVFRIKERDRARNYNRYFWKATPLTLVAAA